VSYFNKITKTRFGHREVYTTDEIIPLVENVYIESDLGYNLSAHIEVWTWKDIEGIPIYAEPICVGRETHDGIHLNTDWEKDIKEAGFPTKILGKILDEMSYYETRSIDEYH
jgi:hypothetical protein